MNHNPNPINNFINDFYEGDIREFKEDLNTIIFYLHYVESEVISAKEIQKVCFVLKKLIESLSLSK